jgi:hypothetical protein
VSACGCLFYRFNSNNVLQLLLIKYKDKNWPRLDDFGGQVDKNDEDLYATIYRETLEESNGFINITLDRPNYKSVKYFYNHKSKYFFMLAHVDLYKDTTVFGNVEIHDNINRIVSWFDYIPNKKKLAYRLMYCNTLIEHLDSLIIN